MIKNGITPEVIRMASERFKVLAEPSRLRILSKLCGGELTVTELIKETGLGQANLSKHLQSLHSAGFVGRRREGAHVCYRLADKRVYALCDMICSLPGEPAEGEVRRAHE